jgi:hypothetical protein
VLVPARQRCTDRAAVITRRRLDPHVVERALAKQPTVGRAVQRDSARQAERELERAATLVR